MGRAGHGSREEGRRLGSTEDQSKALPSHLVSLCISRQGTRQRKAAEGKRQPRVMNLWMSLLAKLRVLHFELDGTV